jgi:putative membrane protein
MTEKFGKALLIALVCSALMMSGYSQSNAPQGGRDRNPQTTTPRTGAYPNQGAAHSAHAGAITKVMEMNVAEVELGKMAEGKAENARVKEFADLMVKDHTNALMKLKAVPGAPSDVKPNAKQQQTMDRLSKLSGAQFDTEYMRTMVSDHQEAVKFLEHLSGQAKQPGTTGGATAPSGTDLASVARELLPTVQHHLQLAQEIQKELQTTSTTRSNKQGSTRSKPSPDSQTPDSQK